MKKKFFDFCSGIGGGRLGLELNGLECVGHSEIDKYANNTYELFFGNNTYNYGDLMKINELHLPDFDYVIAGFPCQTFSIVGNRAGFEDERGQIIYGIIKILKYKRPKFFLLENVKGLVNHNKGETFSVILNELKNIGYYVEYKVLNSLHYGVPQMRERVYIVGIREDIDNKLFKWPLEIDIPKLSDFLYDELSDEYNMKNDTFVRYINNKYNKNKFILEDILEDDYTILDTRQSDLRIYKGRVPTLRAGRHGILYVKNKKLKKLSPYEALLLQGFPKDIVIKLNKNNANKVLSQVGNAMTVSVIRLIVEEIIKMDNSNKMVIKESETAKNGFANERDIINKFNNWKCK